MSCRRRRPFCCAVVAVLGVAFALAQLATDRDSHRVTAAPYVIHTVPHPYDPDWPEVSVILATKCSGCHRPGTGRYDFSSYESLLAAGAKDGLPAIEPGKPDGSLLWEYVAWNAEARVNCELPDAPEMPPQRHEWLSAGQLATLHRWITGGALEYQLPATCNLRPLLESDFPSAKQCAACHPKQFDEWSRSMHAYAQHSPVFEAFNLALIERTSGTIGTFCTRCHTPVGTALGENGSRRNVNRSRLSMEGVTCVACHRRKDGQYKASGRVAVIPGQLLEGCMYGPFDGTPVDGAHATAQRPYIRSSQFCGECHDVTSPQGVRLEEAFSEWHNSPAAKQGITCHQCHMGPVQGVPIPDDQRPLGHAAKVPGLAADKLPLRHLSDHTFAGPDYSLLPDTEFPQKLDWMYETDYRDTQNLTPYQQRTLDELRRQNRASLQIAAEKRYELLRNAARLHVNHPASASAGDRIAVQVDVQSIFAGHSLPTGFTAERQVWVLIEVRDPNGQLIFVSGDQDQNSDLRDEHSYAVASGDLPYDRLLLNLQNKFTALNNKGTERAVILSVNRNLQPVNVLRPATGISASFGRPADFRIAKGSLPPLKTLGRTYPLRLPDSPGQYQVFVRLNFRHLPPNLLDHVGTPHLKHLLEVVVIDQYLGIIDVTP